MKVEIVPLPSMLEPHHLEGRAVVVFDVLRATTTMAAALAAGAVEVRAYLTVEETVAAANAFPGPKLLAGERQCVRIEGFDLGNSPREMTPEAVAGRTIFMTTTNGTRAILAAKGAAEVLTGALVNRLATLDYLRQAGRDVTLLCAGTDGERAPEDETAADAMLTLLGVHLPDRSRARDWPIHNVSYRTVRDAIGDSQGARNIAAAGLAADIDFAARLDSLDIVCRVVDGYRVQPVENPGTNT